MKTEGIREMKVELKRIGIEDAETLWKMQVEAFWDMYENIRIQKPVLQQKILIRH